MTLKWAILALAAIGLAQESAAPPPPAEAPKMQAIDIVTLEKLDAQRDHLLTQQQLISVYVRDLMRERATVIARACRGAGLKEDCEIAEGYTLVPKKPDPPAAGPKPSESSPAPGKKN